MNFLKELEETGIYVNQLCEKIHNGIEIGEDLLPVCEGVDTEIWKNKNYELLCPTTIDIDNFVQNCALQGPFLTGNDNVISYCVSIAKKLPNAKFAHCKAAHTKIFNHLHEEVVSATNDACNAALKECGIDVRLDEIRFVTSEILDAAGSYGILNIPGNELYNSYKIVPTTLVIPNELRSKYSLNNAKMLEDEVYFIDVYGTNCVEHVNAVRFPYPSIYFASKIKESTHRRSTNEVSNAIIKRFGEIPFTVRNLDALISEKTKLKMSKSILNSLYKSRSIIPIECAMIEHETKKSNNIVARFGHSIHIGANHSTILA